MNSWEKTELRLKLVTCIIVSAFVGVLTPILLKSVIDGFFVAMDESAIRFALVVIASVELSAVASSAVFRRTLDGLCDQKSRELKGEVIAKLSGSSRAIDWHDFELFWGRDLRALTHGDIRLRWMRYQDVVVMAILSFVATSMSYLAGGLIAFLFLLQFASAFFARKRGGSSIAAQKEAEHQELRAARVWLGQRRSAMDHGMAESRRHALLAQADHSADLAIQADGVRAAVEESHRLIKGLGIIGVISFGVLFKEDGVFSVGALWALALVMFRVTGPSQNVAKWLVWESQTERAHSRLNHFMSESDVDRELEEAGASELYRGLKSALSGRGGHSSLNFILAPAEVVQRVESCFRLWAKKNRSIAQVRVWSGELPHESLWEQSLVGVSALLLSSQFKPRSGEVIPKALLEFFFKHNPEGRVWICDSVPWTTGEPLTWGYWDEKSDRVEVLHGADHLDVSIPEEIQRRSLDSIRAASFDWDIMIRDLYRLSRINTPNSVLILDKMEEAVAEKYRRALREYDHLVVSPSGARILVLVNCPSERWEASWQRIVGEAQDAVAPEVLETAFIVPGNDPNNRGLAQVLSVCAHALFKSRESYRPVNSREVAA